MKSNIIKIFLYLVLIIALGFFLTSDSFKNIYQDLKSKSITGYSISEANQEPITISIKQLENNPSVYLNKNIKLQGIIKSPDENYNYISDEQGNEFKIKKTIRLKENSKYEIIGIIQSNSDLYYRYQVREYYIEVEDFKEIN